MTGSGPAGLILTPGASARRDHPGLVAIDQAVTQVGVAVEDRVEKSAEERDAILETGDRPVKQIAETGQDHDAAGSSEAPGCEQKTGPEI